MNTRVLWAVFRRNFVGYFANPTGYVFICVFVLLSSIAAFLPYEFFSANLANLAQLNQWFPLIMLVFIPAITMGIWADERRQGTDELLLTIPAGDFEIVCGKYLSAVAIYTVALLFSLGCNLTILSYLGNPDSGLFYCTYIGYWLIGTAMLAVGMVASFLTANLTIAYILGAIFSVPLVAIHWAEAAPIGSELAAFFQQFSISNQFDNFGRGILSLSSVAYFLVVIAVMLYMSMVLIGKRHWSANQKYVGAFHYAVRSVSLVIIGFALCLILQQFDLRADMTAEKLSTLSPVSTQLIRGIDSKHPVVIEAYLSPDVPKPYIQTRLNIISILKEIESKSGHKVSVRFHEVQPNTQTAMIAAERYNIQPQDVWFQSQGIRNQSGIYLGVAFRCGLQSLTIPFIDRGVSAEYALIHALCSVTDPQKKRIGVLKTDLPLNGQFDMQTFSMTPEMRIVKELKKLYNVVEVDPVEPIMDTFDALVAVQPSSLGPPEMQNFIDAIRKGQPTVIFEDPFPIYMGSVPGTAEPRRPQNQMMMMQRQMPPKGDITELWNLLGIEFTGREVVWQDYNPIRKLETMPKGIVFLDKPVDKKTGAKISAFSTNDPISRKLQYLMLSFPGKIRKLDNTKMSYEPLLWTVYSPSGIAMIDKIREATMVGSMRQAHEQLDRANMITEGPKELAARITGELPPVEGSDKPVKVDVVLIADIDILHDESFAMEERGSPLEMGINLNFENVPLILNAIDSVAGEDRFLDIRTRRPIHRTLQRIDIATDEMRQIAAENRQKYNDDLEKQIKDEQEVLNKRLEQIRSDMQNSGLGQEEAVAKVSAVAMSTQKRINTTVENLTRKTNEKIERAEMELNEYIHTIQGRYKFYAVVLPPILPLLMGIVVFVNRRIREYEGVPKSRRTR